MWQGVRHFLLAVQFFTRIPVTGRLARWVGYSPAMLRASAAHFPGVGWLVGGLLCLPWAAGHWLLAGQAEAVWLAAWLVVVSGVMLTGGFHEDGLADLADGLGGSAERSRALQIMKDSRIGSFGALALVLALMGKVVLLAALAAQMHAAQAALVLWLAQVVSRSWPLLLIRTLAHVGDADGSKSKPLADQISAKALAVGALWWGGALALAAALWPVWGWAVAVAVSAAAAGWMRQLLQRRLQGFTGDGLGATQQVSELAFYLGVLLALKWGGMPPAAGVALAGLQALARSLALSPALA